MPDTPEWCDCCGAEGFRLTFSPDGEQVCDGCLAALTRRTPPLAWLRWALTMIGYWIRPYDVVLDARRWRWQPRGVCQYQARKSPAECEAWLRRQPGEDEWSHLTTGQIVAMTNTLYGRQPGGSDA